MLPEFTVSAPPASALVPLSNNVPPFTFVPPVKLLLPDNSNVPFPAFVRLELPPVIAPPSSNEPEFTVITGLPDMVMAPVPMSKV